jgi:hypothetical protein
MRFVIKPAGMIAVAAALAGLGYLAFGPMSDKGKTTRADAAPAPVYINNADLELAYNEYKRASDSKSKARISGKIAESWFDNSDWANLDIRYAQEAKNVQQGASCQRIEIGAIRDGHMQFAQTVAVTAGVLYQARVWVRASEATDVELTLRQTDGDYRTYATGRLRVSKEWRPVEVMGTPEKDQIYLMLVAKQPNVTLWMDDAAMAPVKAAAKK